MDRIEEKYGTVRVIKGRIVYSDIRDEIAAFRKHREESKK